MVDRVCKWAHERISTQDFVLLDTESTSLDGEICDLAILGPDGTTIFDNLIKPVGRVTEAARRVHHISDEMLEHAPIFAQIWPEIEQIIHEKIVITYNSEFDFRIFALSLLANGIKDESYQTFAASEEMWHCLMDGYRGHIQARRWQKLEIALQQQGLAANNAHRALADAQAAYSLLVCLAGKYEGSSYQKREQSKTSVPISPVALAREAEIQSMIKRLGKKQ